MLTRSAVGLAVAVLVAFSSACAGGDEELSDPTASVSQPVAEGDIAAPFDPLWIEATFKCEDFDAASGEEIGPLILWDLDANTFYKEFDWMPKSDAKELAAENGWRFGEDC